MQDTCPSETELLSWVQNDRSALSGTFPQHLDRCDSCRRVIVELLQATDAPPSKAPEHATRVGRFIVLEPLGSGAMGVVYAAYDPQLDRRVALKLVRLSGAGDAEFQGRLLREARAGAAITHPNVVAVFDSGLHQGELFIAMELVDGGSLRGWLSERRRGWREIVDVFTQAGRGLVAAHAAGWLHRDLKPENILINRAGRVMISDFGLASGQSAPKPASPDLPGEHPAALVQTREGTLVGSPAYMAPELHDGGPATALSDQFSFCVTLFEALFGARPFEGDDLKSLFANAAAGRVREPSASVPNALLALVRRGLSADPSKRFRSMAELVGELERLPSRRRTQRVLGASVAAVALLAVAGWRLQRPSCADDPQALTGVWDAARKAQVHDAFVKASAVLGEGTFTSVSARLDAMMERWAIARRENCEATSRGEQSAALLDLRTQCLHRRREELATLTELFTHADGALVTRAISAVGALTDADACSLARVETSTQPPPADPTARATYDRLTTQVAEAKALFAAGRLKDAEERFAALVPPARELGHRGLKTEVLRGLGTTQQAAERYAEADQTLREALYGALAGGDAMGPDIAGTLMRVLARLSRPDEARHFDKVARALLARLPPQPSVEIGLDVELATLSGPGSPSDPERLQLLQSALQRAQGMGGAGRELEAMILNSVGNVHYRQGDFRAARADYDGVAAVFRELYGPDHPKLGLARFNVAGTMRQLGDFAAAHAALADALAIWTKNSGEENPMVASIYGAQSVTYKQEGKLKEAAEAARRALELRIKTTGPDSRSTMIGWTQLYDVLVEQGDYAEAEQAATTSLAIAEKLKDEDGISFNLEALGTVSLKRGEPAKAVPFLERAIVAWDATRADPRHAAGPRFILAQALWRSKGDRTRAVELAKKARAAFTEPEGFDVGQRSAIDEWLAKPK